MHAVGDGWWHEEELAPSTDAAREVVKALHDETHLEGDLEGVVRGILRIDLPRWREITGKVAESQRQSRWFVVRLGFQFDVTEEGHRCGARFVRAKCEAHLEADEETQPQPMVFDIEPKSLHTGGPQGVRIAATPKLGFAGVELSLGEVSRDIDLGVVVPVIEGYPGEDERNPYWRLYKGAVSGPRHLWMVIEMPGAGGVRLAVRAEAHVRVPIWKPLRVGPELTEWSERPTVTIGRGGTR